MRFDKGARFIAAGSLVAGGLFFAWSLRELPGWFPVGPNRRAAAPESAVEHSVRYFPKDPQGAAGKAVLAQNPKILIPIPPDNPPPPLPKEFPARWEFVESKDPQPASPAAKVGTRYEGPPQTAWREGRPDGSSQSSVPRTKELVPVRPRSTK